jgi:hypothetical protein
LTSHFGMPFWYVILRIYLVCPIDKLFWYVILANHLSMSSGQVSLVSNFNKSFWYVILQSHFNMSCQQVKLVYDFGKSFWYVISLKCIGKVSQQIISTFMVTHHSSYIKYYWLVHWCKFSIIVNMKIQSITNKNAMNQTQMKGTKQIISSWIEFP